MDFKTYLEEELIRRQKANPLFSQRAFARYLSVDSSRLSKMLRGDRPISSDFIESFGLKLGLSPSEIHNFIESRNQLPPRRPKKAKYFKQIPEDHFQIISDWRHYAILELMKLPQFKQDYEWISKSLNTTPLVVRDCVERLKRVRLLEVTKRGSWIDTSKGYSTDVLGPNVASQAHRNNQNQFLQMAQNALMTIPLTDRDQSSMMMATSREKMAAAKEKIRKFRRELCEFLESGDEKDEVFVLSVSLFPVTSTNERGVSP